MDSEPARIVGVITAFVTALIALGVAFGLDLSDDQTAAILGVVAVVAPIVAAWWIRGQVTPTARANARIEQAYRMTPGAANEPPTL